MNNQELQQYIDASRSHGVSDAQIKQNLISAGWPEDQVNQVLTPAQASPSIGMPIPAFHPASSTDYHTNMWIVFQYILMFITLAVTAISLAGIGHQFIDDNLGMPSRYSRYGWFGSNMMLGYVASLIVAFPVFAVLFVLLRKKIETYPEIRNIKSRKFFIYIALLWTFIILIIRLVGLVYSFLAGNEYAGASFAHLFVTILTSGSIFAYFILDVKRGSK